MGLKGKVVYYVLCGARKARLAAPNIQELMERGARVYVLLTPGAESIVDREELTRLTGAVVRSSFERPAGEEGLPLEDLVVVAPATYNSINKMAHGIADNFAMACVAAAVGRGTPVYLAPAMNFDLWSSPIVKNSLRILSECGVKMIHPDLDMDDRTCTMAEAGKILDTILADWERVQFIPVRLTGPQWEQRFEQAVAEFGDELCRVGHQLELEGLTFGQAGCISVRLNHGILISATRSCLGRLTPEDLTLVAGANEQTGEIFWFGNQLPSSETALHLVIYGQRPDARAIIHSHCPAITYAGRLKPWRSSRYIRCATFAFGNELAENMVDHRAQFVIAKDHGEVGVGPDIQSVLGLLREAYRFASGKQDAFSPLPVPASGAAKS